jgi:hypothetical protein
MKIPYAGRLCSLLFCWLVLLLAPRLSFAQFTSINKVYKLVNHATGKVLDVDYYGHYQTYYGTFMRDYTGSASQQWKFAPSRANGTGVYEIINRSSGKVLTSSNYPSQTTQNDRWGVVNGVQTNTTQVWQFRKVPGVSAISYEIVAVSPSLWLTADPVYTQAPYYSTEFTATVDNYQSTNPQGNSTGPYQVWDVVEVSANPTSNLDLGVYSIKNVRSGYLLEGGTGGDTDKYGLVPDFRVVQNPDAGVAGQEWTFMPGSAPGYYRIVNRVHQYALEIGGSDLQYLYNQGRQANLWGNWGGPNQQWALVDANSRRLLTLAEARTGLPCVLINYHTGQCLEMGGGGNLPLQAKRIPNQWPYEGTDNQVWYIQYRTANRMGAPEPAAASPTAAAAASKGVVLGLYPNPAQTTATVTLPDGAEVTTVRVYDVRGAEVTGNLYRGHGQLEVGTLAPGVYSVSASDGSHTYHQKLVKN